MVLKRFRCSDVPVLPAEKEAAAAEETSACTSLDSSLSSGHSPLSTHCAVKGATMEPSMVTLKEGPIQVPEGFPIVTAEMENKRVDSSEDRKVSFKNVHVKEFDRVVGDNPSCSFGVPISIGWTLENESEIDMDEYEISRESHRRSKVQLLLTKELREVLLMDWGCSTEEIAKAVKEKVKIKNQRNFTIAKLGTLDSLEELIERAGRKMRKTFKRKSGS